jgi:hypothetical protein
MLTVNEEDDSAMGSEEPGERFKVHWRLGDVEVHEDHIDTGRGQRQLPNTRAKYARRITNRNALIGKGGGIDDS